VENGKEGGGRRGKEEPKWKMGRTEGGYITHLCIMHGAHTSSSCIGGSSENVCSSSAGAQEKGNTA